MQDPKQVNEFPIMDDSPLNNGYGYGRWGDEDIEEDEEEIENDDLENFEA